MTPSCLIRILTTFAFAGQLAATALALDAPKNIATTPLQRPEPGMQARHTKFNEISKQGEAQLIFLGDSITQGWEGRGKAVWAKYFAPMKAANFGVGGDRTEHVLWRLQNGNYDGLKPELTVLMIGTNNTGHRGKNGYACEADQTADGVKAIIQTLREKQPQMKILLLAIFPRGEKPDDKYRLQNDATNAIISRLADNDHVYFMDINKTFLTPDGTLTREIMPDLLHPAEAGYELWAKAILPKVKELMSSN